MTDPNPANQNLSARYRAPEAKKQWMVIERR